MVRLSVLALGVLSLVGQLHSATDPDYASVDRKLTAIQDGKVPPGSTVILTARELNAWARVVVPKEVPKGIRQPQLTLASQSATGSALVDFLKMRQAEGHSTSWVVTKLIEGERPLSVSARIQSANGRARVDLERVEISGVAATGSVLDFLIKTFFLPLYPDAKIGQWFELGYRIERIDVRPSEVRVKMK